MATLTGKTVFITGGSRGIGLAIALRAARDGANIAIAAKTSDPNPKLPGTIHTAAAEIEAAGGRALPLVCDIRFEDQVQAAVEKTVKTFGGIDVCINNASALSPTGTEATERHEPMRSRHGRGIPEGWNRGQRALAANRNRHGCHREHSRQGADRHEPL